MERLLSLLNDKNYKYNYNKNDEVVEFGSLELCLTTKGNLGIFDKNKKGVNEKNYICTMPIDNAINCLGI